MLEYLGETLGLWKSEGSYAADLIKWDFEIERATENDLKKPAC